MKLAVFLDAVWAPLVVTQLGWVDSDLWSSSGWLAASADTYFPTGGWNIPNLSQPNPGARPRGVPKRRLERRPISFGASQFKICAEGKEGLDLGLKMCRI